jgi:hypothetical protein
LSEFEGYFKRAWVDSGFFGFAVLSEYMASYGKEHGYVIFWSHIVGVAPL